MVLPTPDLGGSLSAGLPTPSLGAPRPINPTRILEGQVAGDVSFGAEPQPELPSNLKPSIPQGQIAAINAIADDGAQDEPSQSFLARAASPVLGALDWYDRNLGKPTAAIGYAYVNPVNWFSPTGREMRRNIAEAEGDSLHTRLRQGYEETDTPRFAKGATELIADPLNALPLVGWLGRGAVAGVRASRASGILAGGAGDRGSGNRPDQTLHQWCSRFIRACWKQIVGRFVADGGGSDRGTQSTFRDHHSRQVEAALSFRDRCGNQQPEQGCAFSAFRSRHVLLR